MNFSTLKILKYEKIFLYEKLIKDIKEKILVL